MSTLRSVARITPDPRYHRAIMLELIASLLPSPAWTLTGGFWFTVGDLLLRAYFAKTLPHGFLLAFFTYILGLSCLTLSFFGKNIAIASVAAVLFNVVTYLVAAHLWYGDTLTAWQYIGLALGLVSIAVLELA